MVHKFSPGSEHMEYNVISYECDVLRNTQKRQMSNLLRSGGRFNLESTSSADKYIYNSKTG